MSRSLTTLIDITFDFEALNKNYIVYKVSLGKNLKHVDYARKLSLVERSSKPTALISHSGHYWVLLDKHDKIKFESPDIAFECVAFEDCDKLLLGRLFVRALGKVAPSHFFSGLGETFLFVETDKFFEHTVYKCLKFELKESMRFNSLFISMDGTTFSPLETVYKPAGYIEKQAKFEFDMGSGLLRRHSQGNLIVYSPGNKKFTTNAIDISGQDSISLQKTKTGAIYQFVSLMNTHFSDILSLQLKPIKASWREHYKKRDIEQVYQRIYQVIDSAGGLQVVNASLKENGIEKLKRQKWPVQVEFIKQMDIDSKKPLLVVLDSAKDYEKAGLSDPKAGFYSSDRVTQSIYNSTITSVRPKPKGNELSPIIDTVVKEIAIKQECMQGQFLIQTLKGTYWFVEREEPKYRGQKPIFNILKCDNGSFQYEQQDEFYFDDLNIELPEKQRYFETLNYVIDMEKQPPKLCTIIHEKIAVIPDATKLFEVLDYLKGSNQHGIRREFIEQYLSDTTYSKDPIHDKLMSMLEKLPMQQEFYKEDLKTAKIRYRSTAEQALIDRYFEETGVMLNYSLKGDHNEYLEALTGHFYDEEHSAYFVGSEKGGFKFSRGQFNHLRYLDGPEDLKQLCLDLTKSYFIRNKLATVRPFPFKYLSECREGLKWQK
ncbi:hypothetical protein [Photobacterium aquimaris]|uniref:Uncharacterized protein n=1 Tax=Photobacterium aquimaris TaxID=512643 RepID=A0A2T3HWR6_9GAMM|nr:hypothetical protein [Photobacterium aquimaris]OBU23003.1 hypothetical protein AYY21_14315 [Photobacterium aquimaris]PQJ38768.1 hypothetical protein BTN98_15415 [Photobacterium aquimaris]PSU03328.1 hypothetical protein C0W81_12185 [Photobacterium aquimaris]